MKRVIFGLLTAVIFLVTFAGCGGKISTTGTAQEQDSAQTSDESSSLDTQSASNQSKELNLYIWTEYMPQSVLDEFEKETGIHVNVSTYSTNEDMLAKVKASNPGIYDIVVPTDYMVKMMIDQGLLQKLDKSKITNISNVDSSYLDQYFDKGNQYSLPYLGGVCALCVNKNMVKEPITSFRQIMDPKYQNSIVALNDFRAVIGMTAKSLGYSLNTTDPEELKNVEKQLAKLKPNIKNLDSDSPKSSMLSGETSIGYMWSAEIALCMQESSDFEVVFPEEGCYVFLDNMCILKGAKNYDNANTFINFVLKGEIGKMILDEYPYSSPNKAAVALMPDSYKNNKASNIPPEVIKNGEYVKDIGADVSKYDSLWTDFTK
ncbi:MAG: Putrescine-binding periplasmic protein [Oscillospiraceae bacterium]